MKSISSNLIYHFLLKTTRSLVHATFSWLNESKFMGWVHLKIRKATSLEIANQFIIFFQGRFKWTQILFVKIKKLRAHGKSLFDMRWHFLSPNLFPDDIGHMFIYSEQKEPIIFEMSIPAKAMGSCRWQYFWNLQTTFPDKILFVNVNSARKTMLLSECQSLFVYLSMYFLTNCFATSEGKWRTR